MDGSSSSTKRTTIPPLPPSDSTIPPPSPRSTSLTISSPPPPPRRSHLKFHILQIFLCSVNLIVYALTCLAYISAPEDQHVAATASLWAVSVASFFVAGTFATYGLLLYTGVESRLERARYQQRRRQRNAAQNDHYQLLHEQIMQDGSSPLPFSSSSLALSIDPSTTPNSLRAIPVRNPMRKLVMVSCICLLCFMVRTIMLPVLTEVFDGRYDWPYFLLYFICSEILPMCLILSIFDPPASSSARSRPIPSSPAPAAITSTPQRAPPRASTRSAPRINVQQYDGDGDGDVTQRLFAAPSFHTPRVSVTTSQHGSPQQPQQQTAPSLSLLPSTSSTSLTSSFPPPDSPLDTRHRRSSSDETNDLLRQSLRNVLD